MNKYKYVIFDLDGTLINTTEGLKQSVRYTLDYFGYKQIDNELMESIIGPPIGQSIQKIYGISDEERDEFVKVFRDRYKNVDLLKAYSYVDIYNLLDGLKASKIKIAIATYKRYDYTEMICKHFKFTDYVSVVEGSDFDSKLTKIDILNNCIECFDIDKTECVMIGDTSYDALAANSLNVDFIAVTYGYGFKDDESLKDIEYVYKADDVKSIISFLCD